MSSKWSHLKSRAVQLRKSGKSLRFIHVKLGIPKSTLSNWFKDVELTKKQREKLHANWLNGLVTARKEAIQWHNNEKKSRIDTAMKEAQDVLGHIDLEDRNILELALAVLYLAEGSKKNIETALGSSDPDTLRFFLSALKKLYDFDTTKIRCELHLRYDQDPVETKRYWAKKLSLPLSNFRQVNIDTRTIGRKTYDHYKGVCSLRCGHVAIRRRLVFLAEKYFAIIGQQ
jgi:ribosomal protein L37E